MLKKLSLKVKLISSFLLVSLIPLFITSIILVNKSSNALEVSAFNQLHAIQSIKKSQIVGYFQERMGDISVLSRNGAVASAMSSFEEAFEKEGDRVRGDLWNSVKAMFGDWMIQYKEEYNYYDLFLIAIDGDIVYSVAEESDLGENVESGNLRNSSLGKCFAKAKREVSFADFEPYAPSNGEPASFVGAPVIYNGKTLGVVALQIPISGINNIMQERTGLGETGETYLIGSDKLMRSDSYLDPTNHSVIASFKNPNLGSVDTEGAREALSGKADQKIIIDYNGNPVLSAYAPLKVGDANWAILAEIDKAEAFAPIKVLTTSIILLSLIFAAIIIMIAWAFSASIAKPLRNIFSGLKSFSDQELAHTTEQFKDIINGLDSGSEQVSAASVQLSSSSQSLSEGASEQASNIEEISSSLEEMSSMTRQNADNTNQADIHAKDSVNAMDALNDAMIHIKNSSDETAKIVKTIDEIAMQTNLLALNAAVEAARAGDAGKGFAVVAEEVRGLAQRAAEAAKTTADLIEESQKNAEQGADNTIKVKESLEKVSNIIAEVSSASKEQAQGIEQVNAAISQMDKVTQQNAANSEETASSSEELSAQANALKGVVNSLGQIVGITSNKKSNSLRKLSDRKLHTPIYEERRGSVIKTIPSHKTIISPEDMIPFDDHDELKEF